MRTRLLLISFLLLSFSYRSVAFVVDELFYRVLSTEEGTVSCYGINRPYDETIGTLTIPAEVTYEGTTYQVTDIAKSAFSGLEIYDLTLPEGIVSIGVSAFQGCPISDVKIPASVQTIGKYAFGGIFDGCPDNDDHYCWEYYPVTYTVNSGNSYFSSSRGILYNKDKTKLIDVPYGYSQDIYIPSSLEEIPNDAFRDRDLLSGKNLYITNLANFCKINIIGNPFYQGSVFPKINKIYIKSGDFYSEISGTINIPSDVTVIGTGAFFGCIQLSEIVFPTNGVTEIGDYAFGATKLTEVTLPATVHTIGEKAFYTSWTEYINTGETDEDGDPIYNEQEWTMAMSALTIPRNVQSIGNCAFNLASDAIVTSKNESPDNIANSSFLNASNCILKVPVGAQTTYTEKAGWNEFGNIVEDASVIPYSDGEFFTATTAEGVNITFCVTSNIEMTCAVGNWTNACVPTSTIGVVTIPAIVNGYKVTTISNSAFSGCSSITNINIPNTVTSIAEGAFGHCTALKEVIIPNSVLSISKQAFFYCTSLGKVVFEDGEDDIYLNSNKYSDGIGGGLFEDCPVTEAYIGRNISLSYIYNKEWECGPFYKHSGTLLTDVTFGPSVTNLPKYLLYESEVLTSITSNALTPPTVVNSALYGIPTDNCSLYVPAGTKSLYQAADGWKDFKEIVEYATDDPIPFADENVKAICVANWDTNGDGELSYVEAAAVTDLGEVFKENQNITSFDELQYFTGVMSLGSYAFYGCSGLTSIIIPNSVTSIDGKAFLDCKSLTCITIPNSVSSIGESVFRNCSGLTSLNVENGNSYYDSRDNYNAIIETSTNTLIVGCKNTLIPNSVTAIGNYAFYGRTDMTSITIPNSVTSIGVYAFGFCKGLTSITIPNSVTTIGIRAFEGCSDLTNITIPNSVTSIGVSAFSLCRSLTSITIPNSVTYIGKNAFYTYSDMESIIVESGNNYYDSRDNCNAIIETSTNTLIVGCKNTLIPNSVTAIGRSAFTGCNCNGLTSITIPNSVTSIGEYAFMQCNGLTSITIPNSVTSIGEYAFWKCNGLTSIDIPNSVTIIGDEAFRYCDNLTVVKVGMASPVAITEEVFSNRANATLYVPKGSKAAYEAADYWKEFKSIVEFPNADVNQDGETDVVDVVDIARYVVGTPAETFVEFLADLNSDNEINVADAVVLVKEIAGDTNFAKKRVSRNTESENDRLMLTENSDHSLSLSMDNTRDYTAFQFDLLLNGETDVMRMLLNNSRKNGHQLLYNKVEEGHYRVVVLSISNNSFGGKSGELLNMQFDGFDTGDLTVGNIRFITSSGAIYSFDDLKVQGGTTGISIRPESDNHQPDVVYDLQGRKLSSPKRGVNIVNGKKILVK